MGTKLPYSYCIYKFLEIYAAIFILIKESEESFDFLEIKIHAIVFESPAEVIKFNWQRTIRVHCNKNPGKTSNSIRSTVYKNLLNWKKQIFGSFWFIKQILIKFLIWICGSFEFPEILVILWSQRNICSVSSHFFGH